MFCPNYFGFIFFLSSSESNMSLFMYRVYTVTDEHSSCRTQRSAALLFSCAVKRSLRRTSTCRKDRASPGGNRRQRSGFCRRSGPLYRIRGLHYHLFSPFFCVSFFLFIFSSFYYLEVQNVFSLSEHYSHISS